MRSIKQSFYLVMTLFMFASAHSAYASEFKEIDWIELMPKADLEALLNPPSYVTDVEDGSLEDQLANQIQSSPVTVPKDRYQQALVSQEVVAEMDGKMIRLPGFIVPLEYKSEQIVTKFFLVPYFGACIHVPPPPPNQIILIDYPKGLKLESIYDPYWLTGVLKVTLTQNDVATSSYSLELKTYELYKE